MAYVWNAFAALGLVASVIAGSAAIAIYSVRSWSPRNRYLALAFAIHSIVHLSKNLSISTTDPAVSAAWSQVASFFIHAGIWPHLLVASTFETPLAAPLRSRTGRAILWVGMIASPWLLYVSKPMANLPPRPAWFAPYETPVGPAHHMLMPVIGLVFLALLVLAISAWRRAPPGSSRRRQMGGFLAAFAARDSLFGALYVVYPMFYASGRAAVFVYWQSFGLLDIVTIVLVGYAVLRHQLFEVEIRTRRLAHHGSLRRERLDVYRTAVEGLSRADDPEHAQAMLAALRRTLSVSEKEHAEVAAAAAREDLRHRVERRGRYRVVRELGRGGQGRALLARDLDLDRDVVLKEPHDLGRSPGARERFLAEARAAARVHHPNVVTVHSVLADEDPPLIVLEHVSGGTLADLLQREGKLTDARAASIAADVLRGLERLHASGLIHRDISPANVLLDERGVAKLGDFGLASAIGEAEGRGLGTNGFVAPEVLRGASPDERSDLWSVGALLHLALTGEVARATLTGDALRPDTVLSVRRAALPGSPVAAVAARALLPDPQQRYRDAAEMQRALADAMTRKEAAPPDLHRQEEL